MVSSKYEQACTQAMPTRSLTCALEGDHAFGHLGSDFLLDLILVGLLLGSLLGVGATGAVVFL